MVALGSIFLNGGFPADPSFSAVYLGLMNQQWALSPIPPKYS